MRRLKWIVLAIVVACSSDDDVVSKEEFEAKVVEQMEGNAIVLDDAFKRTAELIQALDVEAIKAQVNSRDGFINYMLDKTKLVFEEAVKESRPTIHIESWSFGASNPTLYIFKPYLDLIPKGIEGPNPGTGAVDKFSQALDDELDRKGPQGQIFIQSYSSAITNALGGDRPTETLSLGYTRVRFMKRQIESLIMENPDTDDLNAAIDEFVSDNPDLKLLVGMLFPAISGVRESSGTSSSSHFSGLTKVGCGTLTLSQVQTFRRAAFLGGVSVAVSDVYEASDENYASIFPQSKMYEALMVLTFALTYDK